MDSAIDCSQAIEVTAMKISITCMVTMKKISIRMAAGVRRGGETKKPVPTIRKRSHVRQAVWVGGEFCVDAGRRSGASSFSSNQWTFELRNGYDDEWDWDDLRTMYGLADDEEEGDVDTA